MSPAHWTICAARITNDENIVLVRASILFPKHTRPFFCHYLPARSHPNSHTPHFMKTQHTDTILLATPHGLSVSQKVQTRRIDAILLGISHQLFLATKAPAQLLRRCSDSLLVPRKVKTQHIKAVLSTIPHLFFCARMMKTPYIGPVLLAPPAHSSTFGPSHSALLTHFCVRILSPSHDKDTTYRRRFIDSFSPILSRSLNAVWTQPPRN